MWFKLAISEPMEKKADVAVEGESELAGAMRVVQALGCAVTITVVPERRR